MGEDIYTYLSITLSMNSSTNSISYDINNIDNEVNFDTEVLNYLDVKGYLRRRQLVKDLMDLHPDERGYSQKSIDRKLGLLVKTGQIVILKQQDELESYGIEKEAGNASYLISKRTTKIKEYLNNVIELLRSDDDIEKKEALVEIENYKEMYVLDPVQLDLLVQSLETDNKDLIDHIIRILYNYVDKRGKLPKSKDLFINHLANLVKKYPIHINNNDHLRTSLIHLLGYYNDNCVIEQLVQDAKTLENPFSVLHDYESKYTANIIESNRQLIFDLIAKLRRENKDEAVRFVSHIRSQARAHLGLLGRDVKPTKSLKGF